MSNDGEKTSRLPRGGAVKPGGAVNPWGIGKAPAEQIKTYPVPSAKKLFQLASRVMPDLILLDVDMPGVDGLETVRLLKADERLRDVPVIMITSYSQETVMMRCFDAGADDFMPKPYAGADLLERVTRFLQKEEMKSEMKTVFVVDDNEISRTVAKRALEGLYKVYAVPSAEKLFQLAAQVMPDLILLDVDMPGVDGLETIRFLKADERLREVPIIMLSAYSLEIIVAQCMRMGVKGFVIKPFVNDDLLRHVARFI